MPQTAQSQRKLSNRYSWIALALAAVAGGVDGIGYLLLYHVFTSHMSGNTVAMMIQVASANWHEAWRHIEPIVVFFFGIVAGIALTDVLAAYRISRMFAIVAALEFVLLIMFLLLAHPARQWMVVWPASAMGVQNAILRRVGHHNVRTTFITGMLTNTAQALVERNFGDFAFYGGIWLCFAVGGILAAILELRYGAIALLLPLSGLAALIVHDLFDPVANTQPEQASGD